MRVQNVLLCSLNVWSTVAKPDSRNIRSLEFGMFLGRAPGLQGEKIDWQEFQPEDELDSIFMAVFHLEIIKSRLAGRGIYSSSHRECKTHFFCV